MKTILNLIIARQIALSLICILFSVTIFSVSDANAQTNQADLTISPQHVAVNQNLLAEKIIALEEENAKQQESINMLDKQLKNLSANLTFMENNYQKQLAELQKQLVKTESNAVVKPDEKK